MLARTTWRVRYYETDQMAAVYHAHYFTWFEMGRAEAFRSVGSTYKSWEEAGVLLPVIECSCQFKSPARYDDLLTIETSVTRLARVRVAFDYTVHHQESGRVIAVGRTVHAFVNRQGRPTSLDGYPALKEQLQRLVEAPHGDPPP